ncbi:uncharacterized protein LOC124890649 [Capsicum annuum]|uniref:uncharacterized protein LOC124890649 n=1 Tax=Capsicum annuum TaxID=4072 RepID=UPI001FB0DBE4|nr:uncharacterized protein LOC124890649 [Capsicum annuum]
MAVSSNNKSPSPLSIRSFPPHPRTFENNNSTPRRSFNDNLFSRPSVLATHRGFNPVTPANIHADSTRMVSNSGKGEFGSSSLSWGFDEKENESKEAKLKSPAKGSKNFISMTILASSKIAQSPKKKILVEGNDPVRTSITLSDGKATFYSANFEEHNQNSEKVIEPKETVPVDGLPPITKTPKIVTFLKENESKAAKLKSPVKGSKNFLSLTISASSKIAQSPKKKILVEINDPVRTSITLSDGKATFFSTNSEEHNQNSEKVMDPKETIPVDGFPSVTKTLKRVMFSEVSLNSESLSDIVAMDSDICNDEPLNLSNTDSRESSLIEDLLEESDGYSLEEAFTEATVDQEEEPAMPIAKQINEPALPVVEDISEAKIKSKARSSTILRFLSLMLVLMIAFLSFSVTDSPILATPASIIDLRFSNISIPSPISVLAFPVLAKANSYFKQFSGEVVSYFSKFINDLGRIDDVHPRLNS